MQIGESRHLVTKCVLLWCVLYQEIKYVLLGYEIWVVLPSPRWLNLVIYITSSSATLLKGHLNMCVMTMLILYGGGHLVWAQKSFVGQQSFAWQPKRSVSGNSWALSTEGVTRLYFDMKAFVTVIPAYRDLIRQRNASVLRLLGSLSWVFILHTC